MSDGSALIIAGGPDPSAAVYPQNFLIELVLRTAPVKDLCEEYHISEEQWDALRRNPVFVRDLQRVSDQMRDDGAGFRMKARMQSEELLKTSWVMIHTAGNPAAVRADLLKFTIRCAGLLAEAEKDVAKPSVALQINVNL